MKIGDKGYYKIGKNKWQYNPSQGSALGGTYTDSQISSMIERTSEKVVVIPSKKLNAKTVDISSKDNNNNNISSDKSNSHISFDKPADGNAKKALTEMLSSGHSKQDIMSAAKAAGISWKENDHEGINWMRASMAIQKHMNETTKTKTDKENTSIPDKSDNSFK